jgi:hypothetical protein
MTNKMLGVADSLFGAIHLKTSSMLSKGIKLAMS